jgi:anti-anti-sigma factor
MAVTCDDRTDQSPALGESAKAGLACLPASPGFVRVRRRQITLTTTTVCNGPTVTAYAVGQLDAANESVWQRSWRAAANAATAPGPLIVHTAGLDFMRDCAFVVLAEEVQRCRRRGMAVSLVSREPTVARVVAAVGLDDLLRVYPGVEAAFLAAERRCSYGERRNKLCGLMGCGIPRVGGCVSAPWRPPGGSVLVPRNLCGSNIIPRYRPWPKRSSAVHRHRNQRGRRGSTHGVTGVCASQTHPEILLTELT